MPAKSWFEKSLAKTMKYLLFLLILGFFFALFYIFELYFKIREVKIENGSSLMKIAGLEEVKNKNLIFLNTDKTAFYLKKRNPFVNKITVEKNYPDKIVISIISYEKKAILTVSKGYFVLSGDGRILEKNEKKDSTLPIVNYYQKLNYYSYNTGDYVEFDDIKFGLSFISYLRELNLNADNLDISSHDVLLFNVGDKKIYFSTEKNKAGQEYELQRIIRQFKIEGRDYREIDLRFNKPVVRF